MKEKLEKEIRELEAKTKELKEKVKNLPNEEQKIPPELQLLKDIAFAQCHTVEGRKTIAELIIGSIHATTSIQDNKKQLEKCGITLSYDDNEKMTFEKHDCYSIGDYNSIVIIPNKIYKKLSRNTVDFIEMRETLEKCPRARLTVTQHSSILDGYHAIAIPIDVMLICYMHDYIVKEYNTMKNDLINKQGVTTTQAYEYTSLVDALKEVMGTGKYTVKEVIGLLSDNSTIGQVIYPNQRLGLLRLRII